MIYLYYGWAEDHISYWRETPPRDQEEESRLFISLNIPSQYADLAVGVANVYLGASLLQGDPCQNTLAHFADHPHFLIAEQIINQITEVGNDD